MANQRRVFQIAERIQAIVAREVVQASDPRFYMVTITSVALSTDLRSAKVYWTVTGGVKRAPDVDEAFAGAEGRLRRTIAKELSIKFIPALKFFYDDTLDVSNDVQRLFHRIAQEKEANEKDPHDS